jgi:hypothetical protein
MRRAARAVPDVAGGGSRTRSVTRTRAAAHARAAATAAAAASAAAAATAGEPGSTRALIWRLQSGGWTDIEAGNLAAIALGLKPARTGWTGAELDHLRFLRTLVNAGQIER